MAGASPPDAPATEVKIMKTIGLCVVSVAVAVLATAATVALAFGLLGAAQAPYFAVVSDSMAPHMQRGDLVVTGQPRELHLGDVVTFAMYGHVVTHRVVGMSQEKGTYETRGDANPGNDPWTITKSDVIGTVHSVVSNAGWPLLWMTSAVGRIGCVSALMIALAALMWTWPKVAYVQAVPKV